MSDDSAMNSTELEAQAFEYVTGTLRGDAREQFERELNGNDALAEAVSFWEEQLMSLNHETSEKAPAPQTWQQIAERIDPAQSQSVLTSAPSHPHPVMYRLQRWLSRHIRSGAGMAVTFTWALLVSGWLVFSSIAPTTLTGDYVPNADYVAVLTDTDTQQPLLTAMTSTQGDVLWLQWEGEDGDMTQPGSSAQLWAKSRRDGQIRPLYVFEAGQPQRIELDQATLRLIKDSSFLLLTREEVGGSAIDEPSDQLLAKGACIRLNTRQI